MKITNTILFNKLWSKRALKFKFRPFSLDWKWIAYGKMLKRKGFYSS